MSVVTPEGGVRQASSLVTSPGGVSQLTERRRPDGVDRRGVVNDEALSGPSLDVFPTR